MKNKSLILFLVAAGFGLVAMLGVMQVMEAKSEKEPVVRVLVATTDIIPGGKLDETNSAFKEVPRSMAPRGAVTDRKQTEGKALVSRAVQEEIIAEAKLSESARPPSDTIPVGMRVATVKVDSTKSHSGLLRPTDRVDILCTYKLRDPGGQQITSTKTVLEFIEVFATDSLRTTGESDGETTAKNISLIVTPEQAALLKLAENRGELHLTLRSKEDTDVADTPEVTMATFMNTSTVAGVRDKKGEKKAEEPVKTESLGDFVAQKQEEVKVEAAPNEPDIPTWTIMIHRGKDDAEYTDVIDEEALAELDLDRAKMQKMRAEVGRGQPATPAVAPEDTDADADANPWAIPSDGPKDRQSGPPSGPAVSGESEPDGIEEIFNEEDVERTKEIGDELDVLQNF
ncbi:Flp pilus assembly protein CpaB [Stratiformator vulcanicus]|uniref:Flp pilus assembly protein RcpC/CpaB domain-containing protein n=1 Tax=Stratiformator vulcanicus TaxID=2527980 RepID=A0A517R053_9PLAN|nr:Flp pilus assembly protein CpaB [Stratiformator vulcanicus]QDT37261.1 hypothetical protein Pan189_16340 [Stratiformator vulcanicus]